MQNPTQCRSKYDRKRTNRKTGYALGQQQIEDWHKECERRRRNIKIGKTKRWTAPEHNKAHCSWKGEQLMATSYVSSYKKGDKEGTLELRGTIPIWGNCYDKKFECLKYPTYRKGITRKGKN